MKKICLGQSTFMQELPGQQIILIQPGVIPCLFQLAVEFLNLWFIPLGYLVFKSGYIPRILGVLLIIAGFGYLIDSVTFFLFPNFDVTISLVTFIGEVLFMLWLLIKGVNVEQWEKHALESA